LSELQFFLLPFSAGFLPRVNETQRGEWAGKTLTNYFDDATCYDDAWFYNVASCFDETNVVTSVDI